MTLNVLGTEYNVIEKKYNEDGAFSDKNIDGYCDGMRKIIVICDMTTYKGWEKEDKLTAKIAEKMTLRHEIVHAFLQESGLDSNSLTCDGAWARNEELVDWIALQGIKIYKAWQEAGAI